MDYPRMSGSKKKSNTFFWFMQCQRRERPEWQDKTNIELMTLCDPLWKSLSVQEKSQYERNGAENYRYINQPESFIKGGYDSFGRPLQDRYNRAEIELARAEKMKNDVFEMVNSALEEGVLETTPFYVVHFNVFCVTDEDVVVPAEMAIVRFSLRDGVSKIYHEFIDPGVIPTGYRADCVENSKATHQIPLDLIYLNQNYHNIVDTLLEFLEVDNNSTSLPPIFCQPKHRTTNEKVLRWLADKSGRDQPNSLRLFDLPMLLYEILNVTKVMILPTINMAEIQLDRDVFLYTPGMACEWHETDTEVTCCASAIVRRWCYILADFACPHYDLLLVPGYHAPRAEQPMSVCKSEVYTSEFSDTASVCNSSISGDSEHPLQSWLNNNPMLADASMNKMKGLPQPRDGLSARLASLKAQLESEDAYSECDSEALGFASSVEGKSSTIGGFSYNRHDSDSNVNMGRGELVGGRGKSTRGGFAYNRYDSDSNVDSDTARGGKVGKKSGVRVVEDGFSESDSEALGFSSNASDTADTADSVKRGRVGQMKVKSKGFGNNKYDTDSTDCEGGEEEGFAVGRYDTDSDSASGVSGRAGRRLDMNENDTNVGNEMSKAGRNERSKNSKYLLAISQKKPELR